MKVTKNLLLPNYLKITLTLLLTIITGYAKNIEAYTFTDHPLRWGFPLIVKVKGTYMACEDIVKTGCRVNTFSFLNLVLNILFWYLVVTVFYVVLNKLHRK